MQIFSTNDGQSHLKLQASVKKTLGFSTLNAHISQSVRSNFMKFLPHDLKQVNYKILRLSSKKKFFFVFFDKRSRNGSFQCSFPEKWPWAFRG